MIALLPLSRVIRHIILRSWLVDEPVDKAHSPPKIAQTWVQGGASKKPLSGKPRIYWH